VEKAIILGGADLLAAAASSLARLRGVAAHSIISHAGLLMANAGRTTHVLGSINNNRSRLSTNTIVSVVTSNTEIHE
jgi:hypothetical protein